MTNTKTEDVEACVRRFWNLKSRMRYYSGGSTDDGGSREYTKKSKNRFIFRSVADIHFDYRLAIAAIENGADKIRINPGNIGDEKKSPCSGRKSKRI